MDALDLSTTPAVFYDGGVCEITGAHVVGIFPVPGARVRLVDASGRTVWTGRTDVRGKYHARIETPPAVFYERAAVVTWNGEMLRDMPRPKVFYPRIVCETIGQ